MEMLHETANGFIRIHIILKRFITKHANNFFMFSQNTPNKAAIGECGRLPIYYTCLIRCIKFWFDLLHMDNNRLPKECYLMLLHLDDRGSTTWASFVKNILCMYCFGHVWYNQGVENVGLFMSIFKERLDDICKQNWHSDVNAFDKLRVYCTFKNNLTAEKYLFVVKNVSHRRCLQN